MKKAEEIVELSVELDREGLEADGTRTAHFVARLRALAKPLENQRPKLAVAFAIDVSGSMQGAPLEYVKRSLTTVIEALRPDDRVSVVTFHGRGSLVSPLSVMGADQKRIVLDRIARAQIGPGGTNIEDGLRVAAESLGARVEHERQVVLLLSDGEPNKGDASATGLAALAKSYRPGITFTCLGYGAHHDENVLKGISDAGGGEYVFVSDPISCRGQITRAVGSQVEVVADSLQLTIKPLMEGVEIEELYSIAKPTFTSKGLRLPLPDLMEDGHRLLAGKMTIPTGKERGKITPLALEVAFRSPVATGDHVIGTKLEVHVTEAGGALIGSVTRDVLMSRADLVRREGLLHADRGNWDSAGAVIRGFMKEIEACPGFVQGDGSDLAEAYEQLLDEAVAYESRPSAEHYRSFKQNQLGIELATGVKHKARRSATSTLAKSMRGAATGALPTGAFIEFEGKRFALNSTETVIGRGTRTSDIPVQSGNVSRRHAAVVFQEGSYYVKDLGSTNGVEMSGKRIQAEKLVDGAKFNIVDLEFVFRAAKKTT